MNTSETPSHEEAIFEAALRLPSEERATYLNQTCAGDSSLRHRVEALLGAFERAGGFLQQPVSPDSIPAARHEEPGDSIGRYKLLQKIGEGGCGVVYMAEQEEPVRRRVALKVIKLGMDTRQVIARFEAERQALALMDHPNIARVLDAGATDSGRPYFVMELVRGVKITEFCDDNKLTTEQRLRLFIQVCHAVQHAHQKGVIHRDIKPSNILVTINDGEPVPKVIDFGIAKATAGRLTDQTLFTAYEQFIGTPAYMSPEQAVLTSLDIDTRSDIYSLGVLLYELLTGRTPFDPKELMAAGFDAMRRTIREQDPPRPSTRLDTLAADALSTTAQCRHTNPPQLIHLLRGDLDWVVMKCLEKDRSRRYETANGLARDIERHLANEPVIARPPSTWYRFQKSARRNKTAFLAAGAVAAALIAGIVVSASQAIRARRAEQEEARHRRVAEAKEQQSEQVARFLKDMLRGVEPSVAMGRDTKILGEVLDKTAGRVGRDLKDLPEVEAELRETMADVYQFIGQYPESESMYRRALELQRQLGGEDQVVVARLLNNLGVTLMGLDQHVTAEPLLQQSLELRKKLSGARHPDVAETLHQLAALHRRQGNLTVAEQEALEALSIRKETLGPDHRGVAESQQVLATVFRRQGRHQEAESMFIEALTLQTRIMGEDHPAVADLIEDLGLLYSDQKRYPESESMLKESLTKRRRILGETHPETLTCTVMLINTLMAQGTQEKFAEAEPLARTCLALRESRDPDDARTINVRSLLGGILVALKRYNEAEPLLLSSYQELKRKDDMKQIPWEGKYVITDTLARIVRLLEETGRTDQAAPWKLKLLSTPPVPR